MIRYVESRDKAAWYALDHDFPETGFDEKVRNRHGYVFELDGNIVGILRYGLFWDSIPFCYMLHVDETHQGRGYGTQLMERWERDMRSEGIGMVMLSTQVDDSAQAFYRRLGYKDAGGFVVNVPKYEQPMEMIMLKGI